MVSHWEQLSIFTNTHKHTHTHTYIHTYMKVKVKVAQFCPTLWAIHSMEFSRPEYWSRQPFPYPGNLSNPGIEPGSPVQADSLPTELSGKPTQFRVFSFNQWERDGAMVKTLPASCRRGKRFLDMEIPWSGKWQPAPVFLPGKSHRQRILVGYSPWGRIQSDSWMTEHSTQWGRESVVGLLHLDIFGRV